MHWQDWIRLSYAERISYLKKQRELDNVPASSGEAERLAAALELATHLKGLPDSVKAELREAAALLRQQADQIERERGEVRGAGDEITFQAKRAEQAEAELARIRSQTCPNCGVLADKPWVRGCPACGWQRKEGLCE